MSMFESYDKLGMSANTDGITLVNAPYHIMNMDTLPRSIYDIKDRFIGYEWGSHDQFDFKINATDTINVNDKAILFSNYGEAPTTETEGYLGQQAYNTVEGKCWTCLGLINDLYIWAQEDKIYYPEDGTKKVDFTSFGKIDSIIVDFYNFRWELIKSFTNDEKEIVCPIDDEMNKLMPTGIYYATVTIVAEGTRYLKNKFTIIVK